jgi:hypothetical protein
MRNSYTNRKRCSKKITTTLFYHSAIDFSIVSGTRISSRRRDPTSLLLGIAPIASLRLASTRHFLYGRENNGDQEEKKDDAGIGALFFNLYKLWAVAGAAIERSRKPFPLQRLQKRFIIFGTRKCRIHYCNTWTLQHVAP